MQVEEQSRRGNAERHVFQGAVRATREVHGEPVGDGVLIGNLLTRHRERLEHRRRGREVRIEELRLTAFSATGQRCPELVRVAVELVHARADQVERLLTRVGRQQQARRARR